MEIPPDRAEQRVTTGGIICRLTVQFAGLVKVLVQDVPEGSSIKPGTELHFVQKTWERYDRIDYQRE